MNRQIYINIAVNDLPKSRSFYNALGFSFNDQFCDETAACLVISDTIHAMLLTKEKFASFAPNGLCDSSKANEALNCLTCESRAEVDELVKKAVAAGGKVYNEPQDHGFMYAHGFQDIDGHVWELAYMEQQTA
jgi:predicted lactoylglutathione lyase